MGKTLKKQLKGKNRRSMKGGFWPFTSSSDTSSDSNWSLYEYIFGPRKKSSDVSAVSNNVAPAPTTSDAVVPTTSDAEAAAAVVAQAGGKKRKNKRTKKNKKSLRKCK